MSTVFRGKGPRENFSVEQPVDYKLDPLYHPDDHDLTLAMSMNDTLNHDGDTDPNHDAPSFRVGQTSQEPTDSPNPSGCDSGHAVAAPGLATALSPASMPRLRQSAGVRCFHH